VELDDRDERNPGFKFNEHELNGIPLRLEIGPHEVDDGEATLVHRPDNEQSVAERDEIVDAVDEHLDEIYDKLYETAEENLEENVRDAHSPEEILGTIGKHGGYVKTPWCGDEACETAIKEKIAAEIVMQPLADEGGTTAGEVPEPDRNECGVCGDPADEIAYFAKSYCARLLDGSRSVRR